MGALPITYTQAKQLTLAYLNDWMNKLPVAQRTAPTIAFDFKAWSIVQIIAQVTMDSDIGKRWVNYYIGSLKQYVIVG